MTTARKQVASAKTYNVLITDEQIALLRTMALRVDLAWRRSTVAVFLDEEGTVKRQSLYECACCGRGSYEHKDAIPHEKSCIVVQLPLHFASLNKQFIAALESSKETSSEAR